MDTEYLLAHISEDGQRTQTLTEHLNNVGQMACKFAQPCGFDGLAEEAELAGLHHDDGKGSDAFQRRLLGSAEQVDHSTAGAQVLLKQGRIAAAFAVAGHHSGLPDGGTTNDTADNTTLLGRAKRAVGPWQSVIEIPERSPARLPWVSGYAHSFYTRMLYSCLVDADFLDTESFMRGAPAPRGNGAPIAALYTKMQAQAMRWLDSGDAKTINAPRNQVLRSCLRHGAADERGLYTLTVPTGGGKTFASLAFALTQANALGLDRIIYIIPYTSIIDQTVDIFAQYLGAKNVLGHYFSADYQLKETGQMTELDYRRALASENWDAPVVVTTAVQFFESLYANRSSRCRKLHNIANSVLIFDEVQTIPIPYLKPCLAAIGELVRRYRCSAVLCTATQPAFAPLFHALTPELTLRELCDDSNALYETLRRTTLDDLGSTPQEALAGQLSALPQVLCVVNRRKTAQELYAVLPEEGSFCLTTLLCAADRKSQLAEIRKRLADGLPCRVVATSLIEAGVDVDFPTAFREIAGLDSILQTAGRCNREGRRPAEESPVHIFELEGSKPPALLSNNISALRYVLRKKLDLQSPKATALYSKTLYQIKGSETLDQKRILPLLDPQDPKYRLCPSFAEAAERFQLIDTPTKTICLPIDAGKELCDQLQQGFLSRSLFRRLGMYSVEVYPDSYDALIRAGAAAPVDEHTAILTKLDLYDRKTGLNCAPEEGCALFC